MRLRQSLLVALAVGVVACVYVTAGSGFAIDKPGTFLGALFPHGTGTGVHEPITAAAIRRGMPAAPQNLVRLIQAGAENVDVTHHFDAEYHFDSASTATFPKRFEKAFAAVHSHLKGAARLADRNPEFFDPSYASFRQIAVALASSLEQLADHPRCADCPRAELKARAVVLRNPALVFNPNPDPHYPTNGESVFAPVLSPRCGLCGVLWPVNKAFRLLISQVESASKVALAEATFLPRKDPLRARLQRIYSALRAYRAFQALGHAFHATQDFFAHTNYVELIGGVAVGTPIRRGTRIPVPQRRADWNAAGVRKVLGDARHRKLESGAANAIWLGEGDYCLGSLYNPITSIKFPIPQAVTEALGLPRKTITLPAIGKNFNPPPGLNYCHYHTATNIGLNKDEPLNPKKPKAGEPAYVNHAFARQAAEDMTAVLWKSFLSSIRRPGDSGKADPTPTPKPKPTPQPKPKPGTWKRGAPQINPFKADYPPGSAITVTAGRLNWKVTVPPQAEFDVRYNVPPTRLSPGTFTFKVTITGKLTGDRTVQGFRTVDAIPLVQDRWDGRSAVGTGQNCYDPMGAEPISCTAPSRRTGTFQITIPGSSRKGEKLSFGIGALNCTACYVRFEYVSQ